MMLRAYQADLAYIHDQGFGDFARGVAPGILKILTQHHILKGRVVDLGCGGGIWARTLVDAGYEVVGVDISAAMIQIARQRVPQAKFHVQPLLKFRLPACQAITALGEVVNYLFDAPDALGALRKIGQNAFEALAPGGLLVFDIAEPGRCQGMTRSFREGKDWTVLVKYQHDVAREQLERRIVTFRQIGRTYRKRVENHRQQLLSASTAAGVLRAIGFRIRVVRKFGEYQLPPRVAGLIARKP